MSYDQQILHILSEVGERGISVSLLAKHVYNMSSTLFSQPDLQEVHQYVQQYLLRNSKSPQSLIESTGRRGYYRLNTQNNADARQLMLDFAEETPAIEEQEDEKPSQDLSLSLFDF
ncbi:hypothetical protein L6472_04685 [Prevotella sp. E13-17]|uniref:hypothetical protein n=1 Tax=Prevotella sp. E13-17 TaxID=2913616 RepID=UPI001EDAD87D|nr:hypothetical protein [Prevotella sp. E13-17]UKK51885.1 hypothetical protein L6472_04685 [Prevotella sp. E13-17]